MKAIEGTVFHYDHPLLPYVFHWKVSRTETMEVPFWVSDIGHADRCAMLMAYIMMLSAGYGDD